jgi:hypothetical protein
MTAGELEGSGRAPLEHDPSRRSVRALTARAMPYTLRASAPLWGEVEITSTTARLVVREIHHELFLVR